MDVDGMGDVAVWLCLTLFVLCTLFNMVVMFNLLIAIISASFEDVVGNSKAAGFAEMARLIAENSYLVPDHEKNQLCPQGSYLLYVVDQDQKLLDETA